MGCNIQPTENRFRRIQTTSLMSSPKSCSAHIYKLIVKLKPQFVHSCLFVPPKRLLFFSIHQKLLLSFNQTSSKSPQIKNHKIDYFLLFSRRRKTSNNCTFCGVFCRQELDRGATFLKANKLDRGVSCIFTVRQYNSTIYCRIQPQALIWISLRHTSCVSILQSFLCSSLAMAFIEESMNNLALYYTLY